MGAMHETFTPITAKDLAKKQGVDIATIRLRWNANFGKGDFDSNRELSPEQVEILSRSKREKKTAISAPPKPATPKQIIRTIETIGVNQPAPAVENTPAPGRAKTQWRTPLLIGLMIAPTAASVENMYSVTFSLSASAHSAIFLTAVLSVSALGFVVAGVRNWYTVGLAALLIAYESFCNLTRIYGGLMGNGNTGNPTRFLGTVTDIFNTGTHGTAIFLGAFTAFFIAAVQYAAVFELNKGK